MTAGVQCDNCRAFAPMPATGWLHLLQQGEPSGFMAALTGNPEVSVAATFCSMKCVAQYATACALISGKATGEEP
jgi:hypothetical protein